MARGAAAVGAARGSGGWGEHMHFDLAAIPHIHIRDDLVDPERYYGRGWYARTSDLFLMERISLAEWKDGKR